MPATIELVGEGAALKLVPTEGGAATRTYPADVEAAEADIAALQSGKADTAHTHTLSDVTDAGTAAALDVPASGNAASGEVVKGDDTRLSDSRAPTAHTHDDRYYTEAETDTLLAGKSSTGHTHAGEDVTSGTVAAARLGTMTGATSGAAGAKGAVPQPVAGDNGRFLTGGAGYGFPQSPAYFGELMLPGVVVSGINNMGLTADIVFWQVHTIRRNCTMTELHSEVQTAGTAGLRYKMLAYVGTMSYGVGAKLYESAEFDAGATGLRSVTGLSMPLSAGSVLLLGVWGNSSTVVLRVAMGQVPNSPIRSILGASPLIFQFRSGLTYSASGGSAPDPGPALDAFNYTSTPARYAVFPKIVPA